MLIAQLPVFLQCLGNDLVEFHRQLGIPAGCWFWRFVQYGGKGRTDGLTFKRQTPRSHFVNHDSKREQVGTRIQFLAMHLLWRHEGDGARGGAQCGDILGFYGAGFVEHVIIVQVNGVVIFARPKSSILTGPRWVTKTIGGFDITMNDPYGVYRVQSVGYLNGQ